MDNLKRIMVTRVLGRKTAGHTVGVFRCVLDKTISKKSAAVGTGAIALRPLVDMIVAADK